MSKYIDTEKLISEIKALKHRKGFLPFENTEITEAYMARGVQFTCDDIVHIIESFQQEQPEVDLEKEIDNWLDAEPHTVRDTAIHFYEIGRNARKEE